MPTQTQVDAATNRLTVTSATTLSGQTAYGTYWREGGTGLDYAMNRYYLPQAGRFTTADPYRASGGPAVPGSWNRYAYVEGDPVNLHDPAGLQAATPVFHEECYETSGSYYSCAWRVYMRWNGPDLGGGYSSEEPGGGTAWSAEDVFLDINQEIRAGKISNCDGLALYAGAVYDSFGDTTRDGFWAAMRFILPTASGGGGYSFNGGSFAGGGWKESYRDGNGASTQAHHAMQYFLFGLGSKTSAEILGAVAVVAYAREFRDAMVLSQAQHPDWSIVDHLTWAARNINLGDYNLSLAAALLGGSSSWKNGGQLTKQIKAELCDSRD